MSWWEKKSEAFFDKTLTKMLSSSKFAGIPNYLDEETKKKLIKFSSWFLQKALSFSIFISISLIVVYTYKKVGFEKTLLALFTMSFIQLIYINSRLSDGKKD